MKNLVVIIGALVLLVVIFVVSRPKGIDRPLRHMEFVAKGQERQPLSFAVDGDGVVRVVYAVVEQDGVYFGEQRVDFGVAIAFLDTVAKKEGIRAVYIEITDTAKYGDAARFYVGIDKKQYFVSSFPTMVLQTGRRLPITGEIKKVGACWIDEAHGTEIL